MHYSFFIQPLHVRQRPKVAGDEWYVVSMMGKMLVLIVG